MTMLNRVCSKLDCWSQKQITGLTERRLLDGLEQLEARDLLAACVPTNLPNFQFGSDPSTQHIFDVKVDGKMDAAIPHFTDPIPNLQVSISRGGSTESIHSFKLEVYNINTSTPKLLGKYDSAVEGGGSLSTVFDLEFKAPGISNFNPGDNKLRFVMTGLGTNSALDSDSNGAFHVCYAVPEIEVTGKGRLIVDGDTTPRSQDFTDFGTVTEGGTPVSRTFVVTNKGEGTLTPSSLRVPTGYTVTEGLSASIAPGASDSFSVRLNTSTPGVKSGQIRFNTNDSDENPFNFSITGKVMSEGDFVGTSGDDVVSIVSQSDKVDVTINGQTFSVTPNAAGEMIVTFDGLGGTDKITVIGTANNDTATLRPGSATLVGTNYDIRATNVEQATVRAGGGAGKDVATFHDSPASDIFTGRSDVSKMTGTGFDNSVIDFAKVIAHSMAGGVDRANLFDTNGDDIFEANPGDAMINGPGLDIMVDGFAQVYAFASTGADTANFGDSPGNDRYYGFHDRALMQGIGFYNRANGFDETFAKASAGNDLGYFFDSAGNDRYFSRPSFSTMTGPGFSNRGDGFDRTFGNASEGKDVATLRDSNGNRDNNRFFGYPDKAIITGAGFNNWASNFDKVTGVSSGGTDVAYLYDSTGNDVLVATPTKTTLSGDGFENLAKDFEKVFAYASTGRDTSSMYDSAGNDRLFARPSRTDLIGTGFFNRATGFDMNTVYASGGNDTAYLFDSTGDDDFRGTDTLAQMKGGGTTNRAIMFDRAFAYASGGNDIARIFGGPGDDTLVARDNFAFFSGDGFYNFVRSFEKVIADGDQGGIDKAVIGTVVYDLRITGFEK